MSYAGIISIGDALNAPFITDATINVAAAPDAAPTYEIFDTDMQTLLASGTCTQQTGQTGCYFIPHTIDSGTFEPGKLYPAKVSYAISAANKVKFITFNTA